MRAQATKSTTLAVIDVHCFAPWCCPPTPNIRAGLGSGLPHDLLEPASPANAIDDLEMVLNANTPAPLRKNNIRPVTGRLGSTSKMHPRGRCVRRGYPPIVESWNFLRADSPQRRT